MITMDAELSEMVVAGASESKLRDVAHVKGMRSLRLDAAEKALAGITSVAEVIENTDGPAVTRRDGKPG